MKHHRLACTTLVTREEFARSVVEGRLNLNEAAAEFKLSRQSAGKWVKRYRELGLAGLADRSSRPHRLAHQSPAELIERVALLRRQGWTGLRIAETTGLSSATISRMLTRLKLNGRSSIEPSPPPVRYEHAAPGDLLHLDIQRLVRIQRLSHRVTGDHRDGVKEIGAEFLYVAIDDHSRIAFTAMYPDQTGASASHFLATAAAWFQRLGIAVRRVLTDNGTCYLARRFHRTCNALGLKHRRTGFIPRAPTARPNASSRPRSANGPTHKPSRIPSKDPNRSHDGPTNTTGTDPTPASTDNRPSADQVSSQQPHDNPHLDRARLSLATSAAFAVRLQPLGYAFVEATPFFSTL